MTWTMRSNEIYGVSSVSLVVGESCVESISEMMHTPNKERIF